MKKACIVFLVLCLLATPIFAASVTVQQGTVGGNATYAVIDPVGLELVPIVANNSVHTDESEESMIKSVNGKVVAAINGGFFSSFYDHNKEVSVKSGNGFSGLPEA